MTQARREFLLGLSLVLLGSAWAIRGVVASSAGELGLGAALLLVVLTAEIVVKHLAQHPSAERVLRATLRFDSPRTRRIVTLFMGLGSVAALIRAVGAAFGHDWGSFLFHCTTGAALSGALISTYGDRSEEPLAERGEDTWL